MHRLMILEANEILLLLCLRHRLFEIDEALKNNLSTLL